EQPLARARQHHTARHATEKADAEFFFQSRELMAQRRLRDVETRRRLGHRALTRDRLDELQMANLQLHTSYYADAWQLCLQSIGLMAIAAINLDTCGPLTICATPFVRSGKTLVSRFRRFSRSRSVSAPMPPSSPS